MADTVNNTAYSSDQVLYIEDLQASLEEKLIALGYDPAVFFENLDGDVTLTINKDDPVYQSLMLLAGQMLAYMNYGGETDIFSLPADVDIDWSSWDAAEASGAGELLDFVFNLSQDDPQFLAAVALLNYGQDKGNEVQNFLNADIANQSTTSSDGTKITLEGARAMIEEYGLDGLEDFASFEESSLEVQANLMQQLVEAQQYFAEIMADPTMSDELKGQYAEQSSSHQSLIMMQLQNVTTTLSTMAQMTTDLQKNIADTSRQIAANP